MDMILSGVTTPGQAMAIKGYSAFPKASALLESHLQIVLCHIQDTRWRGSYPSEEKQSVYSKAQTDWAKRVWVSGSMKGAALVHLYFVKN